jgi:MFS family permease
MSQATNTKGIWKVITASSVGTLIEWYDFYIFGMLAKTISTQFFPEGNSTAALLSTLAIFAAGFIVRPFGALVFGRLGDLIYLPAHPGTHGRFHFLDWMCTGL